MLAAAMAISTACGTAYAKMAMQTFAVLAGARARRLPCAERYTAQSAGKLGRLAPKTGLILSHNALIIGVPYRIRTGVAAVRGL
jgi:streptogramin lyase